MSVRKLASLLFEGFGQSSSATFETWGVLAGAYRGRDVSKRALLTHSVELVGGREVRVLCGRVPLDSVTWDAHEDVPPTCPICIKRDPRFRGA